MNGLCPYPKKTCEECRGEDQVCPVCDGTGKIEEDLGGGRTREYKCTPCRGTGKKSGYTGTFPESLKEDQ
jgi:DnaJ-class molecular chaperone